MRETVYNNCNNGGSRVQILQFLLCGLLTIIQLLPPLIDQGSHHHIIAINCNSCQLIAIIACNIPHKSRISYLIHIPHRSNSSVVSVVTSNMVERLFSRAKLTLGTCRKHMDPDNLEMLLMLKINRDMWSMKSVGDIVNDPANHF